MTYEEASKRLMITPQVVAICCLEKLKSVFSEESFRRGMEKYERELPGPAKS